MTDPRAALAEAVVRWTVHGGDLVVLLAERGVLLVTEERLAEALHTADCDCGYWPGENQTKYRRIAKAALVALSGKE